MALIVLRMAQGTPPSGIDRASSESGLTILPPAALGALTLLLGLYVPPVLGDLLQRAAHLLGG
jgi:formate hydrogenlyase subunit 3/multisubunit Na+/H+ antiporter MnhD subunit